MLIASVKDYSPAAILAEYKNQITVESKFRFLKNPVYMGPIYLNLPKRVEAIGYVFILALLEALDRIIMAIFTNTRIFPDDIAQEALDIVSWMGFEPEAIYLGVSTS